MILYSEGANLPALVASSALAPKDMLAIALVAVSILTIAYNMFNPKLTRVFNDHVMFISATLGMGKTSIVAKLVYQLLNPYTWFDKLLMKALKGNPKPLPIIYSTFVMQGCKPLDIRTGNWPKERGAKIIIDELLLLEAQDLVRKEWFSYGCTLARQLGQQVFLISQNSRLPNSMRRYMGTIGTFYTMKGVSFGKTGRLVFIKYAAEPFIRRSKGFKAEGQKKAFVWIPGSVYKTFYSNKIYGYTVEIDGTPTPLAFAHVSEVQPAEPGRAAHVDGAAGRGARAPRVHRVSSPPVDRQRYDW